MALEDAISRRLSKTSGVQQRKIATGSFQLGNQYQDFGAKQAALAALAMPQISAGSAIGNNFQLPALEIPKLEPLSLPPVNIVMPGVSGIPPEILNQMSPEELASLPPEMLSQAETRQETGAAEEPPPPPSRYPTYNDHFAAVRGIDNRQPVRPGAGGRPSLNDHNAALARMGQNMQQQQQQQQGGGGRSQPQYSNAHNTGADVMSQFQNSSGGGSNNPYRNSGYDRFNEGPY